MSDRLEQVLDRMVTGRRVWRTALLLAGAASLVMLAGSLAGCDGAGPRGPVTTQATAAETTTSTVGVTNPAKPEEYAVYNTVLRDSTLAEEMAIRVTGRDLVVIQTPTAVFLPELSGEVASGMRRLYPDLGDEIYSDFEAENLIPADLEELFAFESEYAVVDVSSIFTAGADGWTGFYEEYPDADGLLTLSRVGFDQGMNNALVCVSYYHGGLGGAAKYVLLTKVEDVWTIRGGYGPWIS